MALVNRWPLTSITTVNDIVSGLTLTNNGSVTFTDNGAYFSLGKYLSFTHANLDICTLSVWFYMTESTYSNVLIGATSGTTGNSIIITQRYSSFGCSAGGGGGSKDLSDNPYLFNNWHLAVLTKNSNILGCGYMDGIQLCSFKSNNIYDTTTYGLGGNGVGVWTGTYVGYLKEARIYDHSLSFDEVRKLYIAGPDGAVASC